jgi:hypothetical protein
MMYTTVATHLVTTLLATLGDVRPKLAETLLPSGDKNPVFSLLPGRALGRSAPVPVVLATGCTFRGNPNISVEVSQQFL